MIIPVQGLLERLEQWRCHFPKQEVFNHLQVLDGRTLGNLSYAMPYM
jgi:hypothetical protein